ncbi:PRC-barrel domain-containing protein [Parvularcula sp. LCG005]|uniref:PRC-barrel domain-containing protein n=1 Tax=Parvularcula sp. LCG005 TaxID=3078805 RepID=UPI0029428520|nr:PRC-barrel domain-containing protein [Parvularcula sp. LCG005]WOI52238.1 PRC-barrel domain-containing protein [Parvularcula sp. LCG005]
MKNLLISTAAAALMLSPAAFAQTTDAAPAEKTEMSAKSDVKMDKKADAAKWDKDSKTTTAEADQSANDLNSTQVAEMNTDRVVYKGANEVSAKELLGEAVIGADGERIARIDDLVISNGKITNVVVLSGGFFGLGGERGALAYDQFGLTMDDEYEPRVNVSMTEDAIQSVAAYETDEMNDYSLASELIGAKVKFQATDDATVISDLILAKDGSVESAILADGLLGQLTNNSKAVDFSKISIAQGDGGDVVVDMSQTEFEALAKYSYDTEEAYENDEADDWSEDTDQADDWSETDASATDATATTNTTVSQPIRSTTPVPAAPATTVAPSVDNDQVPDTMDANEDAMNGAAADVSTEWDETTDEMQEAGQDMEEAAEEAGNTAEAAAKKTGEKAAEWTEEAGDEMEEAGDDIEEAADEAEDEMDQ